MAYTKKNTRIGRFQCDPIYTGNSITSLPIQAFLAAKILENESNPNDVQGTNDWTPVNFDPLDPAITNLPINGVSGRTFGQLAGDIRQAIMTRANAANVPA